MKDIRFYNPKHVIRKPDVGPVFCSCQHDDCWYLSCYLGDLSIAAMERRTTEIRLEGRTLPDKQKLIREQQDYCYGTPTCCGVTSRITNDLWQCANCRRIMDYKGRTHVSPTNTNH